MMKNATALRLIILLVMAGSCSNNDAKVSTSATKEFRLSGEVKGFEDSTWFFLDNNSNKGRDSALAIRGHFEFKGDLPDSVGGVQLILRTKDFGDYKFLWIENSEIKLKGEKGRFRDATIKGSRTQILADLYTERIVPMEKEFDSLNTMLRASNITRARRAELATLQASVDGRIKNETIEFVRENPNSIVSASILNTYSRAWGKEISGALYDSLPDQVKNSTYGKSINQYLLLNKDIKIGDKAVDFEQVSYENEKIKLSGFAGRVILLEFWASWCGPCRRDNPALVKTYKTYKDKGFEILGVSLDNKKENWLEAIEKDGLIWENVSELNGDRNTAALIYGIFAIPDNFLIDQRGTILARNLRGEKLNKKLKELLQ